MRKAPVEVYLKKLEAWRTRRHLPRSAAADELGIPPGTYANWYRRRGKKSTPSGAYTRWIKGFLVARGILSVERFLEHDGPRVLRRFGFEEGQTVMDFGCGSGDYSVILAQVVGAQGQVYALDKKKEAVYEAMGRAKGHKMDNIKPKFVSANTDTPTTIPLPDQSIDAGWFCDVLHDGYFEEDESKEKLLRDVHRILRDDGFIAVHPVHMEEARLKTIIASVGFSLEREYQEEMVFHGSEFHRGTISKFRKEE